MKVYFIGCLHFGHTWMAKHRGFNDEFEHDEFLIESYNSIVNKKDLVYILGDITMENPFYHYQLDRLNGRKKVVLGNHDNPKSIPDLLKHVETVSGAERYKGFLLTHVPIHPNEISFWRGNIHAHIHENELDEVVLPEFYGKRLEISSPTKNKYFNVDARKLEYRPITLDEIIEKITAQN